MNVKLLPALSQSGGRSQGKFHEKKRLPEENFCQEKISIFVTHSAYFLYKNETLAIHRITEHLTH